MTINLELTEQELQIVIGGLAELPLKVSLPLVQKIEKLYSEHLINQSVEIKSETIENN